MVVTPRVTRRINDIVQNTQQEHEYAQKRRRPKIELCGGQFGYSVVILDFCFCLFFVLFSLFGLFCFAFLLLLSPHISIYV